MRTLHVGLRVSDLERWSRGLLTGMVDWTQASWGPPELDLGHMRWNLVAVTQVVPGTGETFEDLRYVLRPPEAAPEA